MFAIAYRYKIKSEDLSKWKKINYGAKKIYEKFGSYRVEKLVKKEKKLLSILEIEFYKSRDDYEKIKQKVKGNEQRNNFLKEFISFVYRKRVDIEEFDVL
ncbi:hypothetical protein ISS07_00450 [Candidatus Woesearchaeota archaeon]|nr:hypothetical protein [Candidatus Woesearchaeota archaeon]